jgi:hypothetical protein
VGQNRNRKPKKHMKTKQTFITTALAVTSILALQLPGNAAVKWDSPAAVPAGQRVEYAKAAIATDAAGNVFSAGYRDYGAGNVQALVTYRLNGGGGLGDAFFRPTADQYHYTAVAFNSASNSLYLTGTRVVAGVNTWFVRSVAVNPGVAIGAQNWITYLNPVALGIGNVSTYGSTIAFDGVSLFVSGCLNNGVVAVKLVPATGLPDATWGAIAPANAGVRYMIGANWTCPALLMPGSVAGGIFQAVRQSFVRATNGSVILGGTVNRATGLQEDMAVLRVSKGAGAVAVGFPAFRDNLGQRDCMFGLAAIGDYAYAAGASVNGGAVPSSMTISLLANGANRGGTPLIGALGSYSNDIEAYDNAGAYTFSQGGNNGATGIVSRYISTNVGAVGPAANFAYGAMPTDEVCDLTIGTGTTTGIVYATGQSWDFVAISNCEQVMRIDTAGFVTGDRLPAGYAENNGNGIIYSPAGLGSVLTGGNSLNAGVFTLQRSSIAP